MKHFLCLLALSKPSRARQTFPPFAHTFIQCLVLSAVQRIHTLGFKDTCGVDKPRIEPLTLRLVDDPFISSSPYSVTGLCLTCFHFFEISTFTCCCFFVILLILVTL